MIEKKAYDLVKALNDFGTYVLHSKIKTYVPNNLVKVVPTQAI